jgi:cytochrome c peroxidase
MQSPALLVRALGASILFTAAVVAQPPVPTPPGNPKTPEKVLLGKALFYEEQISSTGAVACATCHILEVGGGDPRVDTAINPGPDGMLGTPDDRRGSIGVILQTAAGGYIPSGPFRFERQVTPRRAPAVIDAAFSVLQFWDGRVGPTFDDPITGVPVLTSNAGLEAQAAGPPLSPVEMAHIGETWTNIVARLQNVRPLALATDLPTDLANFVGDGSAGYGPLFQAAFGSPGITAARVAMAIATYERTLVSGPAPIDQFLQGNPGALTVEEQRGWQVFIGQGECNRCHPPGIFAIPNTFNDIGVRPAVEDTGRFAVSGIPQDQAAFKVPSLRNVELRAPYMHNGGIATLVDVVEFYDRGGDFPNGNIAPLGLSAQQKADLVAFLGRPLTDPRVPQNLPPFDRPTLWSENAARRANEFGAGSPAFAGGLVPEFALEEPAYGLNPNWTIGVRKAPVGVPGVAFVGLPLGAPFPFGPLDLHVDLVGAIALALPPTINGGTGVNGPVAGVTSLSVPIPDTIGMTFPLALQAIFPDPANAAFVGTPGVTLPIFSQRGT